MTEDILVSIKGLQFLEGAESAEEEVEVISPGKYFERDGRHYVKFDEVVEGMDGRIQNLIKMNETSMEVTKKGLTNVHMIFEENKKNVSYYNTPFGNLLIGISAAKVNFRKEEHSIEAVVDYALEVNYEHLADCTITVKVRDKAETL